jgi:hypothetical protein
MSRVVTVCALISLADLIHIYLSSPCARSFSSSEHCEERGFDSLTIFLVTIFVGLVSVPLLVLQDSLLVHSLLPPSRTSPSFTSSSSLPSSHLNKSQKIQPLHLPTITASEQKDDVVTTTRPLDSGSPATERETERENSNHETEFHLLASLIRSLASCRYDLSYDSSLLCQYDLLWGLAPHSSLSTPPHLDNPATPSSLLTVMPTIVGNLFHSSVFSRQWSQKMIQSLRQITLINEHTLESFSTLPLQQKRKELLKLFVIELLPDSHEKILFSRRYSPISSTSLLTSSCSLYTTRVTYLLLHLLYALFLFYSFFTQLSKLHHLHSWLLSLLLWLLLEIFLIAPFEILCFSFFIPWTIAPAIRRLRKTFIILKTDFHSSLLSSSFSSSSSLTNEQFPIPTSQQRQSGHLDIPTLLYQSHQLAQRYPNFPESMFILSYPSILPSEHFRTKYLVLKTTEAPGPPFPRQTLTSSTPDFSTAAFPPSSPPLPSPSPPSPSSSSSSSEVNYFLESQCVSLTVWLTNHSREFQICLVTGILWILVGGTVLCHLILYHLAPISIILPLALLVVVVLGCRLVFSTSHPQEVEPSNSLDQETNSKYLKALEIGRAIHQPPPPANESKRTHQEKEEEEGERIEHDVDFSEEVLKPHTTDSSVELVNTAPIGVPTQTPEEEMKPCQTIDPEPDGSSSDDDPILISSPHSSRKKLPPIRIISRTLTGSPLVKLPSIGGGEGRGGGVGTPSHSQKRFTPKRHYSNVGAFSFNDHPSATSRTTPLVSSIQQQRSESVTGLSPPPSRTLSSTFNELRVSVDVAVGVESQSKSLPKRKQLSFSESHHFSDSSSEGEATPYPTPRREGGARGSMPLELTEADRSFMKLHSLLRDGDTLLRGSHGTPHLKEGYSRHIDPFFDNEEKEDEEEEGKYVLEMNSNLSEEEYDAEGESEEFEQLEQKKGVTVDTLNRPLSPLFHRPPPVLLKKYSSIKEQLEQELSSRSLVRNIHLLDETITRVIPLTEQDDLTDEQILQRNKLIEAKKRFVMASAMHDTSREFNYLKAQQHMKERIQKRNKNKNSGGAEGGEGGGGGGRRTVNRKRKTLSQSTGTGAGTGTGRSTFQRTIPRTEKMNELSEYELMTYKGATIKQAIDVYVGEDNSVGVGGQSGVDELLRLKKEMAKRLVGNKERTRISLHEKEVQAKKRLLERRKQQQDERMKEMEQVSIDEEGKAVIVSREEEL